MSLDGAQRDKDAEVWKSTFHKSILCDTKELATDRTQFLDTDEGRLLAGLDRDDEVNFFSVLSYVRRWCQHIEQEIPRQISEIYEMVQEHAAETMAFLRTKGCAQKY